MPCLDNSSMIFGSCLAGSSRRRALLEESAPVQRPIHWSILVLCHWIRNLNPTGALQNHSSIAFVRETINPFLADHGMNWGQTRSHTWHGYLILTGLGLPHTSNKSWEICSFLFAWMYWFIFLFTLVSFRFAKFCETVPKLWWVQIFFGGFRFW